VDREDIQSALFLRGGWLVTGTASGRLLLWDASESRGALGRCVRVRVCVCVGDGWVLGVYVCWGWGGVGCVCVCWGWVLGVGGRVAVLLSRGVEALSCKLSMQADEHPSRQQQH